jgi:hypothetical protein
MTAPRYGCHGTAPNGFPSERVSGVTNGVIEVEWFSALLSGFLVCQSTNIQAPNTRETPNLNLQYRQWRTLPPGKQAIRFYDAKSDRIPLEIWSLVILWGLDVGA